MGPAAPTVAGLLLLAVASAAAAQDASTKGKFRVPTPPPPAATADNAIGDVDTGATGATTARPELRPAVAPPPTLRSAIPWRWSRPATVASSTAGECRAQCSVRRLDCASGAVDAAACDPPWTQCLSTCSGAAYSRGP